MVAKSKKKLSKRKSEVKKPGVRKPAATKPAAKKKRPASKQPVAATKQPAAKKSASKQPVAKKPATKRPTAGSSASGGSAPTRWVSSGADDDALTTAMNCERAGDWAGAVAAYHRAIEHGGGSKFGARMQLMQAAYYGGDNATVLAMADELDGNAFGASLPGGLSAIFRARVYRLQNDWPAVAEAARTAIERVAANGGEINGGPVAVSRCEPQSCSGSRCCSSIPRMRRHPSRRTTRSPPRA